MPRKSIPGEPYKYEPYQAHDTSGRRYAPTDHSYVISWFTEDPDQDKQIAGILASMGFAGKIQSDSTLRVTYKLMTRSNIREVTRMLRQRLLPGGKKAQGRGRGSKDSAFHQLDFSIQEV